MSTIGSCVPTSCSGRLNAAAVAIADSWCVVGDDVGKEAKRAGRMKPSERRRLDAEPERATPARGKPKAKAKPYGYSYERSSLHWAQKKFKVWFKTRAARDQSLRAIKAGQNREIPFYTHFRVIDP